MCRILRAEPLPGASAAAVPTARGPLVGNVIFEEAFMNWKKFALAALAALLLVPAQSGGTQAEELTGTLKKIKDTGIITVGHREL